MKTRNNNNDSLIRLQLGPTAGLAFGDVVGHIKTFWGRGGLQVGGIYLPPPFEAPEDSDHNYNITNVRRADPKLGGDTGFLAMASDLREAGYQLWVDTVPNHQLVRWALLQQLGSSNGQLAGDNVLWHSPMRSKVFDIDPQKGRWRRFFDVDDLVGINVEDPDVFALTHEMILRYHAMGLISGLRVDHPGGLKRPCQYLRDLSAAGIKSVIAEAVLLGDETPPEHWPTEGCVGYPWLRRSRGWFVPSQGMTRVRQAYEGVCASDPNYDLVAGDYQGCLNKAKLWVATNVMAREVAWLADLLPYPDLVPHLPAALASLDRYRTYVCPLTGMIPDACRKVIDRSSMHPHLKRILLLEGWDEAHRACLIQFVQRFQQWTGPCTAMGAENTAFFRYVPLACNEVGCEPADHSISTQEFHAFNQLTQQRYPRRFNPAATHDNKWGFYPAFRIGAIASLPDQFCAFHAKWSKRNEWLRDNGAPDNRLEWMIYQALCGFWPYPIDLFKQWLQKAMREAKLQTNWIDQNQRWEAGVFSFVDALYTAPACEGFRKDLSELVGQLDVVARHGAMGQLLLMMTAPGRPVFYQGDHVWEPQGVDPLNRLRQDREHHARLLARVPRIDSQPDRDTDRMVAMKRVLTARRELFPAFGVEGEYTALGQGDDVFAFARGARQEVIVHVARNQGARKCVPAGYTDILHDFGNNHGVYIRNGLSQTFGS